MIRSRDLSSFSCRRILSFAIIFSLQLLSVDSGTVGTGGDTDSFDGNGGRNTFFGSVMISSFPGCPFKGGTRGVWFIISVVD